MYRLPFTATGALVALLIVLADTPAGAKPVSFVDALKAAEPASEAIAASRAEAERARALVDAARSGYYPQVNGTAVYTRTIKSQFDGISFGTPDPTMPGTMMSKNELPFGQRNNWRVGGTAQQMIFDGFHTRANVSVAKSQVQVAELGIAATRAQVTLEVAQAYFDAALAEQQVQIANVTLQQSETTLKETQLNFDQGAAPEFDLVRAEVARDNQSTSLVQFRAQRDVAYVQLRRLIGIPLGEPIELTTTLATDDVEVVVAAARAAAGLPANPTRVALAQAQATVAAGEAALSGASAARFPVLAAASDLGFINYQGNPVNDGWRTDWTVSLNLSIPIFDGWRRRATIRANRAALAASRSRLAQTGELAQVETAQASASVAASTTTLEISTRTVEQARRAYQIAELRFSQGASTHLEIVDARVQLEQALLNQARSAHDLRVARLRQELLPGLPISSSAGF